MNAIHATMFDAQMEDGSEYLGGYGDPDDANANDVPTARIVIFEVVHNTFSHAYYAPDNMWYRDDEQWPGYAYPTVYELKDGSTLTVDYDSETGHLRLTQTR